jgi:GT2 family glycosyltransferase
MNPVFVLGPHRSGTSVLTRVLNHCGLAVGSPESLLPPTADNEGGYWESLWLVDHNDLLLGIFGGDWRTSLPIDIESLPVELLESLTDRASAWAAAMDRGGPWVAKDPRLCLTAGFWKRVRSDASWVLGIRHPAAAVASLVHRRGDRVESREEALAIWRRHLAAAVLETEGKPRLIVDYDSLIGEPAPVLSGLVDWLRRHHPGVTPPADLEQRVAAEVDPRQRRHRAPDLPEGYCEAADIRIYEALVEGDLPGALERLRAWPAERAPFRVEELVDRHAAARSEVSRLSAELASRLSELAHLKTRLEYSDNLIRQSEPTLNRREVELERARSEVASLKRSWSYRVGQLIVSPASLIKKLAGGVSADPTGVDELSDDAARYRLLGNRPTIDLLLHAPEAAAESVRATVDSIIGQSYPDWRLTVAVEASAVSKFTGLSGSPGSNDRISVIPVPDGGDTGEALASALDAGSGEFVAPLQAGDVLTAVALLEMASRLDTAPGEIDMLYSDEERIAADGTSAVYRKPGFSPELLLSFDYLQRPVLCRRDLATDSGGFVAGRERDAIYDLLLRAGERARRVEHLPEVLCRTHRDATTTDAIPSATLTAAATRRGLESEAREGLVPGTYRVRFEVPDSLGVSIVVPTAGNAPMLRRCIESIRRFTLHPSYEILVVYLEAASRDGALRHLAHDIPFNFAKINNHAVRHTTSPHLLFLNDDVEATHEGWLRSMLEYSQQQPIGAVGARLLYPDRTVQHAGIVTGIMGGAGHAHRGLAADRPGYFGAAAVVRNCAAVTGACMMTRRDLFDQVGGFTESFPTTFNDVDYCLKVRDAGHRVVYTPHATLQHHESRTRGRDDAPVNSARHRQDLARMLQLWDERLLRDPYYNPHLTLWNEDFSPLTAHDTRVNDDYFRKLREETGLD